MALSAFHSKMTRRSSIAAAVAMFAGAAPARRAPVAFHYGAHFDDAARDWYGRFELLVTGGILSATEGRALLRTGSRLVAYEWSSAFYPGDSVSAQPTWQREVLLHRDTWLLNAEPAGGAAAEPGREAFWYDFGNPDFRAKRAAHLAGRIRDCSYGGIFLDTLGFEQIPSGLQQVFAARHPGVNYDACQADFLKLLRQQLRSNEILFLNQGYRKADLFLPFADYDLSESYFTSAIPTGTRFHKWHDPSAPWDSIRTPMDQLIAPAANKFSRVKFVHLNYASGNSQDIRRAILYSYAAAKLWDHDSYLVSPDPRDERNEVYFADLGSPEDETFQENTSSGVAWRTYRNAVVALHSGPGSASILNGQYRSTDPPQGLILRR